MIEAGFHANALRMVVEGSVDAAAIDSQVLAIELRDHPDLAKRRRSIGTIGPSTIQPVVASTSRLTAAERRTIAAALLACGDRPDARQVMDPAFVACFLGVDGDAYDDIRLMLRRVREAGLLDAEWRARWAAVGGPASPVV